MPLEIKTMREMEQELKDAHAEAERLRGRIIDLKTLLKTLYDIEGWRGVDSLWGAVERELKRKP